MVALRLSQSIGLEAGGLLSKPCVPAAKLHACSHMWPPQWQRLPPPCFVVPSVAAAVSRASPAQHQWFTVGFDACILCTICPFARELPSIYIMHSWLCIWWQAAHHQPLMDARVEPEQPCLSEDHKWPCVRSGIAWAHGDHLDHDYVSSIGAPWLTRKCYNHC